MAKKVVKQKSMKGWKRNILVILIAILLVMFFAYAIESVYSSPKYEKYCLQQPMPAEVKTQAQCEQLNGSWQKFDKPEANIVGYCDLYFICGQNYNTARESYELYLFIFNIIIGIALVVISFFIKQEIVSTSILLAGGINLIYATIRYWGQLSNILRTIILGIALAFLIYITYKKLK